MVRGLTIHLSDGVFGSAVPTGLGVFGLRGPRVETRGYFLSSLTGLTPGAPLISGLNPGLFSVAPSGLQDRGTLSPHSGLPIRIPCRGSPLWLPIRFERGHVVAPQTALGTCPRSCPGFLDSVGSEPSVANLLNWTLFRSPWERRFHRLRGCPPVPVLNDRRGRRSHKRAGNPGF